MKHYIIGEILENGEIERGETEQGFVYKNSKAFYEKLDEVCYIPEKEDYHYTYKNFLEISKGSVEVAQRIFEAVDWQFPESYLEDCIAIDEVSECSGCGKMFESYEVDNCPYCNHLKDKY